MEFLAPENQLTKFLYTGEKNSSIPAHLFRVERGGCCYAGENFNIARGRRYPYYTIHLIFDGCAFFQIDDKNYFLTKGDAFLITPGKRHNYCRFTTDTLGLLWLELSGSFCPELFKALQDAESYAFHPADSSALLHKMTDLLAYLKNTEKKDPYLISEKVYAFLMFFLQYADDSAPLRTPLLFSKIKQYIQQNLSAALEVQELAALFQVSTTYINRLFHRYTGMPTSRYIRRMKIEQACSLLTDTDLSCEAVGETLGFYDAPYFYKVFKSVVGVTPASFRRQSRPDPADSKGKENACPLTASQTFTEI